MHEPSDFALYKRSKCSLSTNAKPLCADKNTIQSTSSRKVTYAGCEHLLSFLGLKWAFELPPRLNLWLIAHHVKLSSPSQPAMLDIHHNDGPTSKVRFSHNILPRYIDQHNPSTKKKPFTTFNAQPFSHTVCTRTRWTEEKMFLGINVTVVRLGSSERDI